MRISKHLQIIKKDNYALCFHSLLGNLFLLEPPYLRKLESFKNSRKLDEKEMGSKIIQELSGAHYIIEDSFDERAIIKNRNQRWLQSTLNGE